MRLADPAELKTIYTLLASRRDIFPHVRQDTLSRRIEAKQCIYEDGVVITFQQYKKLTPVGNIKILAKSVMLHQVINGNPFIAGPERPCLRAILR